MVMSAPIKISDYDYVKLDEYQGKYRIEQGRTGKDGQWWAERVRKYTWKDKVKSLSDKDGNLCIQLGNKDKAIEVLKAMLFELTADSDLGGAPF